MILYKYMMREHANVMFAEGRIRLGSLHAYQAMEATGDAARGDADEGMAKVTLVPSYRQPLGHSVSPTVASLLGLGPHMDGVTVLDHVSIRGSTAAHLFCVATVPRYKIMTGFDCDTCIEIHEPIALAQCIQRELEKIGFDFWGWVPVRYVQSRVGTHLDMDALSYGGEIKDLRFAWQREVRGVWLPRPGVEVLPFRDLVCPDLPRFCRLHPYSRLLNAR